MINIKFKIVNAQNSFKGPLAGAEDSRYVRLRTVTELQRSGDCHDLPRHDRIGCHLWTYATQHAPIDHCVQR